VPTGVWSVVNCGSPVQEISMLVSAVQDIVSKFTETMNVAMQRLSNLETRLLSADPVVVSSVQSEVSRANSLVITPVPQAPAQEKPPSVSDDQNVASVSWVDQAKSLVKAGPRLMFNSRKPAVGLRVCGQASTSSVKGVSQQLTCFATRLHLDVTEEELAEFL